MAAVIGARIKALREYLDLEAGQLAYKAKVDRSYIFYLERNERPNVSGVILGRIADALNTSVDYLLGRTNDPGPPAGRQGPDPRVLQDAEHLSRATERVRRYSMDILDILQELEEIAPDLVPGAVNILVSQVDLLKLATEADRKHHNEGEPQSTTA
jgi:transcriptional regulator with XRE-family HTH domain